MTIYACWVEDVFDGSHRISNLKYTMKLSVKEIQQN